MQSVAVAEATPSGILLRGRRLHRRRRSLLRKLAALRRPHGQGHALAFPLPLRLRPMPGPRLQTDAVKANVRRRHLLRLRLSPARRLRLQPTTGPHATTLLG